MKKCYNSKYNSLCGKGVHVIKKHVTLVRVIKRTFSQISYGQSHKYRCTLKWHIPFWEGQDGKQNLNEYQT